jgi:hypothetical protein
LLESKKENGEKEQIHPFAINKESSNQKNKLQFGFLNCPGKQKLIVLRNLTS